MKKYILFVLFVLFPIVSNATVSYSDVVNLSPGWNIVSTPKILESHSFSIDQTSSNFDVFVLNASSTAGWSTLADIGQTEFTPLFGYFINNKSTSTQTLTFNYKASTTPNQRLFERTFTKTGWYSFGIANPTYAKTTIDDATDTNNPSTILNSIFGSFDSVIDLTDDSYSQNINSLFVGNIWKQAVASDINSLNDLRENKGYAIYVTQPNALYSGFQNDSVPQPSVSITANGNTASTTIYASSSVNISWSSTNVSSCNVLPENWSGISGTQNIQIISTTTFSISCAGLYSGQATSSVIVNIGSAASLSKQSSYANQAVAVPQTAYKLGAYTLAAGTTEDLNLNMINVMFGNINGENSSTTDNKITDVYVVYGPRTTNIKSTISTSTVNAYSINYTLAKGQTIDVAVYGTISSSIGTADKIITKLSVVGQTSDSSQTVTAPSPDNYITGQIISVTEGTLTPSVYATVASSTVVAGNLVKAGSFQFIATGDTFTIDQLTGDVPFASAGNVASVIYKINGVTINGAGTSIDTSNGSKARATTTGLNIVVPANSSNGVIVDAYLNLASIGTPGAATSSSNVRFILTGFEKMTSTGVLSVVGADTLSDALAGNYQYAYASVPTITNMDLPESGATSLVAGTKTLARVKISADAAGAIDWRTIQFYITKPAQVNLGSSTANLGAWSLTDDSGNVVPGTFSSTTGALDLAATAGNIRFVATNPETISAGGYKVYRLKTTVSGVIATNDAVTTQIKVGTAGHIQSSIESAAETNATFTWSDRSYAPHSVTKPDWNNDVLVKNIPTDSQQIIN